MVYALDINETAEILGCIASIFDISILNKSQLEIYNILHKNYHNKNKLLQESKKKTIYLTERVKRYLELHPLDKEEVDYQDFKKIADRLCCNVDFVKKCIIKQTIIEKK